MDVAQNKKVLSWHETCAETQHLKNRKSGKVSSDFKPKHAIEDINEMVQNKPQVIYQVTEPPKVQKVVRAIPQWADSGDSIAVQNNAFLNQFVYFKNNSIDQTGLYRNYIDIQL